MLILSIVQLIEFDYERALIFRLSFCLTLWHQIMSVLWTCGFFFQSHNCVKFSKFLSPYLKDMHTAESVQCTHPTIIAVAVHAIDRKSYFLIHALCHAVHRFIKWHEHSLTLLHNWILNQILYSVNSACFVCQLISCKNWFRKIVAL